MSRKKLSLSLNFSFLSAAALSLMLGSTALFAGQEAQQRGIGEGQSSNFSNLDQDQDGYISQKEAQDSRTLSSKFKELDQNSDQKIDQSEFSAFEDTEGGVMDRQEETPARSRGNYPD